ncbi:MAG: hypothetical protein K2Q28_09970 [Hyphomicrobium sp.]|nr:hypothetical protein [Hyphomicrobium sp.]
MRDKKFARDNHGHRRLLALAIQDYLRLPGATVSGEGGKSLVAKLQDLGVGTSKGVLDRLKDERDEALKGADYPSQSTAERIAEGMAKLGFWPAGDDIDRCLHRLPAFFDGFENAAMEAMRDVITHAGSPATYVSYQYSNMDPSAIIIGRFTFAPFTDLHYAPVTNTIRKTRSTAASITYEGIAWSDASKNIYTFSRVPGYDFPFFTVFNDIARIDGGKSKIVALNGTGLGSARQHNRHLTSITLCNMPYPEDDSPIYSDQHDRLPEAAQNHLLNTLAFGHTNHLTRKA